MEAKLHSHKFLTFHNGFPILEKIKTNITELHCKSIVANKQWNSVLIRSIHRDSVYNRLANIKKKLKIFGHYTLLPTNFL